MRELKFVPERVEAREFSLNFPRSACPKGLSVHFRSFFNVPPRLSSPSGPTPLGQSDVPGFTMPEPQASIGRDNSLKFRDPGPATTYHLTRQPSTSKPYQVQPQLSRESSTRQPPPSSFPEPVMPAPTLRHPEEGTPSLPIELGRIQGQAQKRTRTSRGARPELDALTHDGDGSRLAAPGCVPCGESEREHQLTPSSRLNIKQP
jgi:hypothetical protein